MEDEDYLGQQEARNSDKKGKEETSEEEGVESLQMSTSS